MNSDRGDHRGRSRIRLVEAGRVDGGVRRANAKNDLAIAERVGGEKCRDRSGAIDLAAERRLRDRETGRAHAKLTGDRRAIGVPGGGRHPSIERVALRVHCERDVRLAAYGIDPRPQPIEDAPRLSIGKRGAHGRVDVGCDAEIGIGRLPRSRPVHEHHR